MDVAALPKIELHLHLDCSVSWSVAQKVYPGLSLTDYRQQFVAPPKCRDLADFLTRAKRGYRILQTPEMLRLATDDLFDQLLEDRVRYAEIRLAPLLHTREGLSAEAVAETVLAAGKAAEARTGISHRFIFCTLRRFSQGQSLQTVRLVERYRSQGVGGFDIAGDEAGYPLGPHLPAFQYARTYGIPVTMHAGEARGADSVREAINEGHTLRLGHGVRAWEDPELMTVLKAREVHFEVCPTSNVQTNVFATLPDHPVDRMYRAGHALSINTDGRALVGVSLNDEYRNLQRVFGWQWPQFLYVNRKAVQAAFLAEAEKAELQQQLEVDWARYS